MSAYYTPGTISSALCIWSCFTPAASFWAIITNKEKRTASERINNLIKLIQLTNDKTGSLTQVCLACIFYLFSLPKSDRPRFKSQNSHQSSPQIIWKGNKLTQKVCCRWEWVWPVQRHSENTYVLEQRLLVGKCLPIL